MMAFFPLLTSPPVFLPLLLSGARALSLRPRVRFNRLLPHKFLARHTRPLGRIPFPFLPSPLASCLHLLLIRLLSSCLFLFLPLSFFSWHRFSLCVFVRNRMFIVWQPPKGENDDCDSENSLCVGFSCFFLLLPFYFLLRLVSQPEIHEFSLSNLKNTNFPNI